MFPCITTLLISCCSSKYPTKFAVSEFLQNTNVGTLDLVLIILRNSSETLKTDSHNNDKSKYVQLHFKHITYGFCCTLASVSNNTWSNLNYYYYYYYYYCCHYCSRMTTCNNIKVMVYHALLFPWCTAIFNHITHYSI